MFWFFFDKFFITGLFTCPVQQPCWHLKASCFGQICFHWKSPFSSVTIIYWLLLIRVDRRAGNWVHEMCVRMRLFDRWCNRYRLALDRGDILTGCCWFTVYDCSLLNALINCFNGLLSLIRLEEQPTANWTCWTHFLSTPNLSAAWWGGVAPPLWKLHSSGNRGPVHQ